MTNSVALIQGAVEPQFHALLILVVFRITSRSSKNNGVVYSILGVTNSVSGVKKWSYSTCASDAIFWSKLVHFGVANPIFGVVSVHETRPWIQRAVRRCLPLLMLAALLPQLLQVRTDSKSCKLQIVYDCSLASTRPYQIFYR